MGTFRTTRNVELSLEKALTDAMTTNWSAVTVTKNFTQATEKTRPVVCFQLININSTRLQIGSDTLFNSYLVTIDIFATSDGQRLDLADFVLDTIKDGWIYYIHANNEENPQTLDRTSSGRVHIVDFMRNEKVDFGDNTDKRDRFRQTIVFICRKT